MATIKEAPIKNIKGKDLKVGDQIKTWYGAFVQVLEIKDARTQTLNGQNHELVTAYCTDNYNITVFLNRSDLKVLTKGGIA